MPKFHILLFLYVGQIRCYLEWFSLTCQNPCTLLHIIEFFTLFLHQSLNMCVEFQFITFLYVSDWAWVDWGNKCRPSYGVASIHVRPGLERPLGDIQSELTAVHWWSETADAPAAGGGIQPGFRGPVHIRKAVPTPPPTSWSLQPCTASPTLRRRGDQCPGYDELWTGRPPVGTILRRRRVSVQPAKTGKWDKIIYPLLRNFVRVNATLNAFHYLFKAFHFTQLPEIAMGSPPPLPPRTGPPPGISLRR